MQAVNRAAGLASKLVIATLASEAKAVEKKAADNYKRAGQLEKKSRAPGGLTAREKLERGRLRYVAERQLARADALRGRETTSTAMAAWFKQGEAILHNSYRVATPEAAKFWIGVVPVKEKDGKISLRFTERQLTRSDAVAAIGDLCDEYEGSIPALARAIPLEPIPRERKKKSAKVSDLSQSEAAKLAKKFGVEL